MTLIVKTITRLTVGLILLYGIYIALRGHLGPGGGFAGGVIVALSFIHILIAFGKDAVLKKLTGRKVVLLMSLFGIVFLAAAMFNFVFGGSRGTYALQQHRFKIFGTVSMPIYDVSACFIVGLGIFAVFVALAVFFPGDKKE
jgi:multicomponent Na+:H+ antiporter subunit B